MKVTVNYWAQVKNAAGKASEEVDLVEPCSVQELVSRLAAANGDPLKSFLLDDSGSPRTNLLLIVGDRHVNWDDSCRVQDGDVVTILPPISGGQTWRSSGLWPPK